MSKNASLQYKSNRLQSREVRYAMENKRLFIIACHSDLVLWTVVLINFVCCVLFSSASKNITTIIDYVDKKKSQETTGIHGRSLQLNALRRIVTSRHLQIQHIVHHRRPALKVHGWTKAKKLAIKTPRLALQVANFFFSRSAACSSDSYSRLT